MHMTFADFYLICFIVGLALSVFSLVVGVFRIDFPGRWDNFLHMTHGVHGLHGHGAHLGHGHGAGGISPFNFTTILAFLTWFGGAGYLLSTHSGFAAMFSLGVAILAGLVGGSIVFWFLVQFMVKFDHTMDPADYELIGTIGRLSAPLRPDGTGEMAYTQKGVLRAVAVRSEHGVSIDAGVEVTITRFEDGIAYVRPWHEVAEEFDRETHV